MIYSSLAVIAMSASALVGPFNNHVHLHPKASQLDTRVSIVLANKSIGFRDVKIGDHVYTVGSQRNIEVKAPAGTVIYAVSPSFSHRKGDAILEVTPAVNHKTVNLD